MRSSPSYKTMSESPFVGWIVPHPWQELEYEDDDTNQEPEDNSDYDDEGEFTLR